MKSPLHEWITGHIPEDKMTYKASFIKQVRFIREQIPSALNINFIDTHEFQGTFTVIGEHTSKSIRLPVVSFKYEGISFILRDNFHDWKISVSSKSSVPNIGGYGLFDIGKIVNPVYCEGFKKEWVYGSYRNRSDRFTVEIISNYDVYCFFKILTKIIK